MSVHYAKSLPAEDYADEARTLMRMLQDHMPRENCYCECDEEPCLIHGRMALLAKVHIEFPSRPGRRGGAR